MTRTLDRLNFPRVLKNDRRAIILRAVDELDLDLNCFDEVEAFLKDLGHHPPKSDLIADISWAKSERGDLFTADDIAQLLAIIDGDPNKLTQILEIVERSTRRNLKRFKGGKNAV